MFSTDPGPNRAALGFSEAIVSAFEFLIKEYDFHLVTVTPTFVRYESPRVFAIIYHGRASFELGFEVGLHPDEPGYEASKFSLGDILDLTRKKDEQPYKPFQSSTAQSVRAFVPKLAALVRTHADPILRGDAEVFRRLEWIQTKNSQELLREWKLSEVRENAESAWRQRDYTKLVSLYESIREWLTPAEAKKLDYAKKHSSK